MSFIKSSFIIGIISAILLYIFNGIKPHYHIGDAHSYYLENEIEISQITINNPNFIKTEDNFTLFIESCGDPSNTQHKTQIIPIIFISGGPGFPPQNCPQFLSLLSDALNNQQSNTYYIPYIYHQRGSGNSTRPFNKQQSFSTWKDKSTAMGYLHQKVGIYQQILDIERIRQSLYRNFTKHKQIVYKPQQFKISLIAHSFGCIFAGLYSAEFAQNVDKLVLIAGAPLLDFNVFYSKHNVFGIIKQYLPHDLWTQFDLFKAKYTNFNNLMESVEEEINKVFMEFGEFYTIANKAYLKEIHGETYSSPLCDTETNMKSEDIGGWMTIGIFYDMGMIHFWKQNIHSYVCSYPPDVMVLHLKNDLQTEEATFEYIKPFKCGNNMVLKNTISHSDHTIVYATNQNCLTDLVDKMIPIFQ